MSIELIESCRLPLKQGEFRMYGFLDHATGKEHCALAYGDVKDKTVLARLHSECLTGDALGSQRCDCGAQLDAALERTVAAGAGVLLYLRQEGRGIGLLNKIRAYALQDAGADTVEANEQLGFPADMREYEMCKPMFDALGVQAVRLLTNNPLKVEALEQTGVQVAERVAHQFGANQHNQQYLQTKAAKMRHLLDGE